MPALPIWFPTSDISCILHIKQNFWVRRVRMPSLRACVQGSGEPAYRQVVQCPTGQSREHPRACITAHLHTSKIKRLEVVAEIEAATQTLAIFCRWWCDSGEVKHCDATKLVDAHLAIKILHCLLISTVGKDFVLNHSVKVVGASGPGGSSLELPLLGPYCSG